VDGTSSFLVRTVRLAWSGGSPLARTVDRIDGLVLIVAVTLGLLLVPIMLAVGTSVHANVLERAARQAATRHEAAATLTEDAPRTTVGGYGDGEASTSGVRAHWRTPGGPVRTGWVQARNGLRAGATVDVWLDGGGRIVAAPVTPADATVAAVTAGLVGWLFGVGLLALARTGVHHALDARRYRGWDREWERLDPRPE
jgi:hypothetical protein